MNEIKTSCAPTDREQDKWKSINWNKCQVEVRKLQARIVKAQKEGKHGKVKSLQWILTHSFAAKALAVKRVTSNKGKHTSGVDNVQWSTSLSKLNAVQQLKRRGYNPLPLKRVHIKKKNGKLRPLGIPTMKDRAMQALYLFALDPISETTGDNHSYGFRKERGTRDAIEQCFIALSRRDAAQWVLEGDIKGCFDHISHEWLANNIPVDKMILQKWLKSGFMLNKQLYPTEEGTPQGGIISPTLANMTLDGIQKVLNEKFKIRKIKGKMYNPKVNLVRYADDFIITAESKEILELEIMPFLKEFLRERGLTLSEEKTKITHIDEGFDFLGFNIRKYNNGVLLIKPSKDSQKEFQEKIKEVMNAHKSIPHESLIRLLNPIITGWANYYQHCSTAKVFQKMDFHIFQKLQQWSLRRHPAKGKGWVVNKYFHNHNGRSWVFASSFINKKGERKLNPVKWLTDTKIVRYAKVKYDANPYDTEWKEYFEERETRLMLSSAKGKKSILAIWNRQEKKCPHCNEKITSDTPWRVSERIANGIASRCLVHNYCGRENVESKKLEEYEPVSE
jgi:RNA-directed DNA polymerase